MKKIELNASMTVAEGFDDFILNKKSSGLAEKFYRRIELIKRQIIAKLKEAVCHVLIHVGMEYLGDGAG